MALNSRSSRMPRALSWVSTMFRRSSVKRSGWSSAAMAGSAYSRLDSDALCPGHRAVGLLPPLTDPEVEADHAILVSHTYDGDVARDVVLRLDNLLRRLRDVGGIGKG